MSRVVIQRFFNKHKQFGDQGCGAEVAARRWAALSETILPPSPLLDVACVGPACGALCKSSSPARALELQGLMLDVFARLAKDWSPTGAPRDIPEAGIVCAFEIYSAPPLEAGLHQAAGEHIFASMTVATGRAGRLMPRMSFALLEPPLGAPPPSGPFEGGRLCHSRRALVAPSLRMPSPFSKSDAATTGELHILTEDEFSASLLRSLGPGVLPAAIKVFRLRWSFDQAGAGLDTIVVDGIDGEPVDCFSPSNGGRSGRRELQSSRTTPSISSARHRSMRPETRRATQTMITTSCRTSWTS